MIIGKNIAIPVFVLFLLFTSMFISLVSIYNMPQKMMGGSNIYVITSTKDRNPIRSNLDIRIAYGLENMSYIEAVSPEIFVFTVYSGMPVTVRGVIFDKFLKLEHGKIVSGYIPHRLDGALIGSDASKKLGIHPGESITLYGSFTTSFAVVNITGIYSTGGPADDEILITLPTARKLSGIAPGKVSIIRLRSTQVDKVNKLLSSTYPKFIVDLNSTSQTYMGERFNVTLAIKNIGTEPGRANYSVEFENQWFNGSVEIRKEKNITIQFNASNAGKFNITAIVSNDVFYYSCYTQINIVKKPALIEGPSFAYVNKTTEYTIATISNRSVNVGKIKVIMGNYTREYNVSNGHVNVTFPRRGNYTLIYYGKYYKNATMNVSVYDRTEFFKIANITPISINGTIYVVAGSTVGVLTSGEVYIAFDGSGQVKRKELNITEDMRGNHIINVTVIYGNLMAQRNFLIHIIHNYTPEILSPIDNNTPVIYGENITFTFIDEIPIKEIRYVVNGVKFNRSVNQSFNPDIENYTYNITVNVNSTKFSIEIMFEDYWGRHIKYSATCKVILYRDIIPPQIYANDVKIWGGNKTYVKIKDNEEIANVSVYFYGHYFNQTFNSKSGTVEIDTMFRNGDHYEFVPEGTYKAIIIAFDKAGNENTTSFNITINNTRERNPPIIIGKSYEDLSGGYTVYKAYDNTGHIIRIACYEGATLIKESYSSTLNITSKDISNGSHHLIVEAVDINFNYGYMSITITKNYTDVTPPEIHLGAIKIWGGNTTLVYAKDDVMVKKISVEVFGRYFNGTTVAKIKTSFEINDTITYIQPGTYLMRIWAWDIYGNVNTTTATLEINNSGEKNPPLFILNDFEKLNATDRIEYRAYDNVGIRRIWVIYDGNITAESYNDTLNFSASILPCGHLTITIGAEDLNGNTNFANVTLVIKDNIPPRLTKDNETVWSGNITIITATDNVRVAYMRVLLMGHEFTSNNGTLKIKTWFGEGINTKYLPERNYNLIVAIKDGSGNSISWPFTLRINNTGEKIKPIIDGPVYGVLNSTNRIIYRSIDNVGVKRMWIELNNTIIVENSSNVLTLNHTLLPGGRFNVTVFSEDVNGNVATMNATIIVTKIKHVTIKAALQSNIITTKERGLIVIGVTNENVAGYYQLSVYLDGSLMYQETLYLQPYERKSIYIYLPYLEEGTHKIKIDDKILVLNVEKTIAEKLPTDLVLKYAKDLKFTESKGVIYKGFQISEGNFILVLASLVVVTMMLLFLGIYSTTIKSLKAGNIGILRAIGASNRQIWTFFMRDSAIYILAPVILGIIGGYLTIMWIDSMKMLTAFGHTLIIVPTWKDILTVTILSITFTFISLLIIFKGMMEKRVVHMMGGSANPKVYTLDEIISRGDESSKSFKHH